MDLNDYSRWGWLVVLGTNLLGGWLLWSLNRKFTTREDCAGKHSKGDADREATARVLTALEQRCTEIEVRLDSMPPLSAVHAIQLTVAEVRGELRSQGVEIQGVREILGRLEDQVTLLLRGHMEQ